MFLRKMQIKPVIVVRRFEIDLKGLGYLISMASVFFLGAVAWPEPGQPSWHMPAVILGMTTSIVGMVFRYKAHLDQQREIKKAEAEAKRR
jgi:hypothetical protein